MKMFQTRIWPNRASTITSYNYDDDLMETFFQAMNAVRLPKKWALRRVCSVAYRNVYAYCLWPDMTVSW